MQEPVYVASVTASGVKFEKCGTVAMYDEALNYIGYSELKKSSAATPLIKHTAHIYSTTHTADGLKNSSRGDVLIMTAYVYRAECGTATCIGRVEYLWKSDPDNHSAIVPNMLIGGKVLSRTYRGEVLIETAEIDPVVAILNSIVVKACEIPQ
jgi:hypothetical protein